MAAMTTLDEALQRGLALHRDGNFSQAEEIYARVLAIAPDNASALHLSGLVAQDGSKRARDGTHWAGDTY